MDSSFPQDDADPDAHLAALVSEFFDRRQAGEKISPDSFVAEHADIADHLRRHLAGVPLIDKACSSGAGAAADVPPVTGAELPRIKGYELLEEIGRGGMGVVYKALQISTKRDVALKVMLAGPFASTSARRRFEREVELAARFQHPGIVRVLESEQLPSGQRYYAMDYVDGLTLDRFLAASRPDVRGILGLFAELCEAVDHAHQHDVVHRDLKPRNVLIDDQGKPHVLDFGLAKATDHAESAEALTAGISSPGQVLGTLRYLSPEQAAGMPGEIDARTDVYALGVMLYEALTGALPFDVKGRPSQVIQCILESPPISPCARSNRVDRELETLLLKALEKQKDRRYDAATEMAGDIRRYLAGEPILARAPGSLYILRKKLRKHLLAVAIGAVFVALALIVTFTEARSRRRELFTARRAVLRCQRLLEGELGSHAFAEAQSLHTRYPELPETILLWAQAQYRNEDTRESAILLLERELKRDRANWAQATLLAEIYQRTGNTERAKTLRMRARRDGPDTAESWYIRSFATLETGRAMQCTRECLTRKPTHHLAWRRLTLLRLQTGDLAGALQGADELVELGQDTAEWTVFKGHVFMRQGRFRQAVEQYSRVLSLDSEGGYTFVYRHRAHAHRRVGEYAKAVEDYTRLVKAEGETTTDVWILYQRATPLWILGRTDEALEDYERVRFLLGRPLYADARRFLILRERGRGDEAQQVLDAALRDVEDPWLRRIFLCLAGRLAPGQLVADAAGRNNPEHICEAYYYAGEICLLADQPAEARWWFERCVQTGLAFDPDTSPADPMNEYELAQWRLRSQPTTAPVPHP